ncbi:MAG TPA: transglutaminaseTgpA domain-containing protein [Planctomycetota bacterium]|jgi:hypothetical protein
MDLYRILRLSLYLMIFAGAFALAMAEVNISYLLAVLVAGVLGFIFLDSNKLKPAPKEFVAALVLALLVYHLLEPLRHDGGWDLQFPAACAHFLFSASLALLLLAYSDWVLILIASATLAIVILSGIVNHSATMILRMVCFVVISVWTLFIHSLWRSVGNYAAHQRIAAVRLGNAAAAGVAREGQTVSERALMQGAGLTAMLSVACLLMGLFLFFSAPRFERFSGWLMSFTRQAVSPTATTAGGDGNPSGPARLPGRVDLQQIGPLHQNRGNALSVLFAPLSKDLAESNGRIYLRGAVYSHLENGVWSVPSLNDVPLKANEENVIEVGDPTSKDVRFSGTLMRQFANDIHISNPFYFAAGPLAQIKNARVLEDSEGVLHPPADQAVQSYEVACYLPVHASALPPGARAEHPDAARYVKQTGIRLGDQEEIRTLARETITGKAQTDLEKVTEIVKYLRQSGRYRYTRQPPERGGEPVCEFLLHPSLELRSGHCAYFASAFVVLCRMCELPARLATGFTAPMPAQTSDDAESIVFKNSDAHAWGEVFFQGCGWVAFDPTPPTDEVDIAQTPPPPVIKPVAEETQRQTASAAGRIDRLWDVFRGWNGDDQRNAYEKMTKAFGGAGRVFTGRSLGGWIGAVLAWVCTAFVIGWLVQSFMRRGRPRAGRTAPGALRARAALSFYNDLLQVLSRRGFVRRPGQTPREFAEHVLRYGGEAFRSVLVVTAVFESVRYGGAEITQEEFNALHVALDHLRELTFVSGPVSKG